MREPGARLPEAAGLLAVVADGLGGHGGGGLAGTDALAAKEADTGGHSRRSVAVQVEKREKKHHEKRVFLLLLALMMCGL